RARDRRPHQEHPQEDRPEVHRDGVRGRLPVRRTGVTMRRRPAWWPENEPFPPRRRGYVGYGPPPVVRWIGCLVLTALGVAWWTGALAGALFGGGRVHPFFALPILAVIVLVILVIAGGLRRVAQPMNRLIDAAQRIESGDYSTRVPEEGSPDIRSVARAF